MSPMAASPAAVSAGEALLPAAVTNMPATVSPNAWSSAPVSTSVDDAVSNTRFIRETSTAESICDMPSVANCVLVSVALLFRNPSAAASTAR